MGRIFLTVLNMSLTASYVIIVVIIVRLMLKRAPKVVSYALWSVVAFRLAIPFSFESVFSLIPRANNAFRLSADAIYRQNYSIDNMMGRVGNYVNHSVHLTSPETAANRLAILTETAAYIWFSGIIALLAYSFISVLLLKGRLKGSRLIDENIFEAPNLKTPFVLGLIKPRIYLPAGLGKEEQNYILVHEQTHIRRKDHIVKAFAFLITAIHWFNPLVWAAFVFMSRDMELSCDEKVLKEIKEDIKKSYAGLLLNLAAGKHFLSVNPIAFGEGNVKER